MLPASWLSVRFPWSFPTDTWVLPLTQHEFIHSGYSELFTIMINLFSYPCMFLFNLCDVYSMHTSYVCAHGIQTWMCGCGWTPCVYACAQIFRDQRWILGVFLYHHCSLIRKLTTLARLTWQCFAHLHLPILGRQAHGVRHDFIHGCWEFEHISVLAKKPLLTTEPCSPVLMVCLIIHVSKHISFWISITKTPQLQVKYYDYYKICLFMVIFTCAVILSTGNHKLLINQDIWCHLQNA